MGIERLQEFWPEWKTDGLLGEGSFGKVYKAEKNEMGFSFYSAIKHISIPSTHAESDSLLSEGMSASDIKEYFHDIVNDFVNEIRLTAALKGAPNIVFIEDYKILESKEKVGYDIFIRMELLHSFRDYIGSHTPTEGEIVKMGIDIANALEICQKKHIIHRDIKPANIFLDDYGNFKLGDFGIAKELEKTMGAVSSKGTFSFMAPEVAKGQRYDSTVDIYSLALVMYTLLNKSRPPFIPAEGRMTYNQRKEANDRRLAGEALPELKGVSDSLNNILLTACSYDPSKRFKTASAFKNALLSYKNQGANNTPKPAFGSHYTEGTVVMPHTAPRSNIEKTVTVAHRSEPIHKVHDNYKPGNVDNVYTETEEEEADNTALAGIVLGVLAVIGMIVFFALTA